MNWYLRGCPVCSGDLHEDAQDKGWVVCFMCGRTFRVRSANTGRTVAMVEPSTVSDPATELAPSELPVAA